MNISFRGWLSVGAIVSTALVAVGSASADAPADATLVRMDSQLNQAKTQFLEYEIVNQEPGKGEKKLGMNVYIKGEKRYTEFTAPADMKGTKVLILSPTQMYVYLPAFGKVRRIASHTTDQGFMGMTFTQDDFAAQVYGPWYSGQQVSDSGGDQKLTVLPKAGQTTPYGKLEFTVLKDNGLPSEIKYFNASGTHVKTETRSNYKCEGKVCTPMELKMTDHSKGGQWTKFTTKTWKVNQDISDDVFSKRNLEK
jgi:outer membrane lipoprotein-sorting protein